MTIIILDALLRGVAIALFMLMAIIFRRDWRRSQTTRLGAALSLAAACYVALIAVDAAGPWTVWRLPLHFMSLSAPPLFWLFAASWFDDEFELRPAHVAFLVATTVVGLISNYLFWVGHVRGVGLGVGWRALSVVAVTLAMRAALRGWSSDLIEARRRLRIGVCIVIALAILWIVAAEIDLASWPPPAGWRLANAAGMAILAAAVAIATLGWREPTLMASPARSVVTAAAKPGVDDSVLLARLDADMRRNRLYRQDGLTITAVAARMGVPEYRLRRAINQGLGARNFNAYLNAFRLEEACEALADPAQREVSVVTIALDAGFGSLAPFNRAFRATTGFTPSEFRARAVIEISNSID